MDPWAWLSLPASNPSIHHNHPMYHCTLWSCWVKPHHIKITLIHLRAVSTLEISAVYSVFLLIWAVDGQIYFILFEHKLPKFLYESSPWVPLQPRCQCKGRGDCVFQKKKAKPLLNILIWAVSSVQLGQRAVKYKCEHRWGKLQLDQTVHTPNPDTRFLSCRPLCVSFIEFTNYWRHSTCTCFKTVKLTAKTWHIFSLCTDKVCRVTRVNFSCL